MHTIDILTGPVHSGKTTHLISWIKLHRSCAGILSPIVDNKRQFYSIHNEIFHPFESEETEMSEDLVAVGKYRFFNSSFKWAQLQLQQAMDLRPHWLIIDEIGPIEIRGEGFEPRVSKILREYPRSKTNRLIFVIREKLLDEAVEHYQLGEIAKIHESFLDII